MSSKLFILLLTEIRAGQPFDRPLLRPDWLCRTHTHMWAPLVFAGKIFLPALSAQPSLFI